MLWRYVIPLVCIVLLAVGSLAAQYLPQRPDGDGTAVAEFQTTVQQFPLAAQLGLLDVRHQFWYTLAGALLAVWLLDRMLRRWPGSASTRPRWSELLLYAGGLLWLAGWGWTQTTGWQDHLFVPPAHTVGLGPAHTPTLTFEEFLVPPAPDGPGRSLTMRVRVNDEPVTVSEQNPLFVQGWVIHPRWYGGLVRLPTGDAIYFGGDGTRTIALDGQDVTITVDVETLAVRTEPQIDAEAERYAIITAHFDPGAPLRRVAVVVLVAGIGLSVWRRSP